MTLWKIADFNHNELRQEFVEDRLKEEGDFLIRLSPEGNRPLISVLWKGQCRHVTPMEDQVNNKSTFSFGVKEFSSLDELVAYHFQSKISLNNDELKTKLIKPIRCPKTRYKEFEIETQKKIGSGSFADVFQVKIKTENITVAMKTMKVQVATKVRDSFLADVDMMRTMSHENVLQYLGSVVPDNATTRAAAKFDAKILMELVSQGSLEKLLRKSKISDVGKCKLCLQIAQGVQYLHKRRIVHRELTTSSVLIHLTSDGVILAKVGDYGYGRFDESAKCYEVKNFDQLPSKSLSPECVNERKWSTASDIWAYGILIWEVVMNGQDPFLEVSTSGTAAPQTFANYIAQGRHPPKSPEIKEEIWNIMTSCWKYDPKSRANVDEITVDLERIYRNIKK